MGYKFGKSDIFKKFFNLFFDFNYFFKCIRFGCVDYIGIVYFCKKLCDDIVIVFDFDSQEWCIEEVFESINYLVKEFQDKKGFDVGS